MAAQEPGREAAFARRIDPRQEPGLSPQQRLHMEQVERALRSRLRGRNVLLALGIGAVTVGICILRGRGGDRDRSAPLPLFSLTHPADAYTFYSVSQERFLDDLEQEAEAARARARARAESSAS